MQTVLQSQMQTGAFTNKQSSRSSLDASRIGSVSLPLRRRFLSGSSLVATRAQQRRQIGAGRSIGLRVRAEKVIKTLIVFGISFFCLYGRPILVLLIQMFC